VRLSIAFISFVLVMMDKNGVGGGSREMPEPMYVLEKK
jgi:hypothetical protein